MEYDGAPFAIKGKSCAADEFTSVECQGSGVSSQNRVCSHCSTHGDATCAPTYYRTGGCGNGAVDHDCLKCTVCEGNSYIGSACQAGGVSNNQQCAQRFVYGLLVLGS